MFTTNEEITLEQEKEELVRTFRKDSPDLYEVYESIFRAMASVPPIMTNVFIRGDGTSGQSQRNYCASCAARTG